MESKKKNLLIAVGFAVALLALILIFSSGDLQKKYLPAQKKSVTPTIQTEEDINKIIRQALDTRNSSLCETITGEEMKSYCEDNLIAVDASDKGDQNICTSIKNSDTRAVCKDNVIITKALTQKNQGLCDDLTDQSRVSQCKKDVLSYIQSQNK